MGVNFYHDSLALSIGFIKRLSKDTSDKTDDCRFIIFGNNCRKYREKTGVSQENFAHEKNLQRTFYGDVERGKRNLTLANIFKIADALGVNPKVLFDEMPDSNEVKDL
ncbi:helix-turn-helix domain-containing protein [Acinetobacter pittii]|uniref:helix-turn-helix domain-containing protein n=1 Tax=Acinetobacter pittii TaxID=48296 RepID=UPI002DBCD794|nr:helix-turn-helix transcriptional regulator [Acinetobacter pittii]MEB6624899.1 helix-turn-helix domain-containing protein [Acinetobacter pittii]